MKLGIVTKEQFQQEVLKNTVGNTVSPSVEVLPLEKPDERNQTDQYGVIEPTKHKGRSPGDVNVPEGIRKLIADDALHNGRESALLLAADFGISSSSVSAYSHGATSTATYDTKDKTLHNYLQARKQRITKKALRVLTQSLDTLTPEKLNGIKAKDASSIAKDMSAIVSNMTDKTGQDSGQDKPKFVIYAPQIRDERSYDTIVVTDNY